ncbi:hypothetical protein KSS94_23065 [Pseudomonas fakonensis]|uniref:Mannose-1-phosphate guanyltransferase C-terminal domain-containing protein n=1 Tax=Pseudomonas fakonensis TaxID=2842355 RepID=A0ABX8N3B5_9PSED|nr:hypothetical protein [Pseudomonas fakonensis]QXH50794.1 hypothetical protein KSS94_23065 [Pseudomonas fakonensis]
MWWVELQRQASKFERLEAYIHPNAKVAPTAMLVGSVRVEEGAIICHGAYIEGPVVIGKNCRVGNYSMIRGSTSLASGVRLGFGVEIKNAIIGCDVSIGPQCFVADSKIEHGAYLGAQVRTSNHRLDRQAVKVWLGGELVDTGMEKLGCFIGAGASLGIQTIVLPGRMVAPGSLFAPGLVIEKNLPSGRYRIKQQLEQF